MKFISGGQTGADRGGLEAGRLLGFKTGGWVPKGWLTENGPDYSLMEFDCREHLSAKYPPRTRANVFDSDATVWFGTIGSAGYVCTYTATVQYATRLRPFIPNPTPQELWEWILKHDIKILNVAGNRESKNRGIKERTKEILIQAFTR